MKLNFRYNRQNLYGLNPQISIFFLTLAILFFQLNAAELTGNLIITLIAGYEGILCGLIGVYIGLAEVLNDLYDKKIFPV